MKYKKMITRSIILFLALGCICIGLIYTALSEENEPINKNSNNIALLYPGITLSYYAIAQNFDDVKLVFSIGKKALKRISYHKMIPSILNLKGLAYTVPINIEELLSNKINVALVWDQKKKFYAPIKNTKIKLITLKCCSEDYIPNRLMVLGNLTGDVKRAKMIIAEQKKIYDELAQKIKSKGLANPKNQIHGLQIRDRKGKLQLTLYDNYAISGVQPPGNLKYTSNVATSASNRIIINSEELLKLNPEIIIIKGTKGNTSPQSFYNNALYKHLNAVKNKKVYKTPKFSDMIQEPLFPLVFEWMAIVSYPQKFIKEAKAFRAKIRRLYKKFYNVNITDAQIDSVLNFDRHDKKYRKLFT